MSKGLHHYSAPLAPDGSLSDVIHANNVYNMDPGGFTLGLRWWMIFGTAPGWLRAFPFLFFVITMLACAGTALIWTKSRLLCLTAGLIPAFDHLAAFYAFELRPYSIEACGVALAVLLLERLGKRPKVSACLGLGLSCAIFLTSRYSFVATAMAAGVGVLWTIRHDPWKRQLTLLASFCLPVLVSSAAIFLISLSHQNPGSNPPDYVDAYLLFGKSWLQILRISATALINPEGFGSTLFIATYSFFSWQRIQAARVERFTTYFFFVASANIIFILLSLAGKYPWCPQARWGITLNIIAFLSWFPTIMMMSCAIGLRERYTTRLCILMFSLAAVFVASSIEPTALDSIYPNVVAIGPAEFKGKRILVVKTAQASLRYLYEYGPLKRYAPSIYPDSFVFEDSYNSNQKWESFDYVIFSHMTRDEIHGQLGDSMGKLVEISNSDSSPIYRVKK